MGVSDAFQRDGGAERAARPGFDLVVSGLRRPPLPPGAVDRPLLIERLTPGDYRAIVSVVAPPGYGKSTLLSQWAERDPQAFGWVTAEESDHDPKVLLTYVAEALDGVSITWRSRDPASLGSWRPDGDHYPGTRSLLR